MRNRAYLAWIAAMPCAICTLSGLRQASKTDAHHYGPHAYGRKASDYAAIPLCHAEHHIFGRESVHVLGRRFAGHHGIDVLALIETLNQQWRERKAA